MYSTVISSKTAALSLRAIFGRDQLTIFFRLPLPYNFCKLWKNAESSFWWTSLLTLSKIEEYLFLSVCKKNGQVCNTACSASSLSQAALNPVIQNARYLQPNYIRYVFIYSFFLQSFVLHCIHHPVYLSSAKKSNNFPLTFFFDLMMLNIKMKSVKLPVIKTGELRFISGKGNLFSQNCGEISFENYTNTDVEYD